MRDVRVSFMSHLYCIREAKNKSDEWSSAWILVGAFQISYIFFMTLTSN